MVLVLFFISQVQGQPAPVQPVGDQITNQTKDEGDQDLSDGVNVDDDITGQLVLSESNQTLLSVSDNVGVTLSKSAASEGVHRRGGGGNNDHNEEPHPALDAIVRVQPNPVPAPGTDVEVFGITNASSASRSTFELFGPGCPLATGVPCAVESDLTELSPPSFNGSIPDGLCSNGNCEENSVMFAGKFFPDKGEYHIRATFYDSNDRAVAIEGENFRVLSFFVVPESPIGGILLIGPSLASLGAYAYYLRLRNA